VQFERSSYNGQSASLGDVTARGRNPSVWERAPQDCWERGTGTANSAAASKEANTVLRAISNVV